MSRLVGAPSTLPPCHHPTPRLAAPDCFNVLCRKAETGQPRIREPCPAGQNLGLGVGTPPVLASASNSVASLLATVVRVPAVIWTAHRRQSSNSRKPKRNLALASTGDDD
jgi:hypothetical protein